MPTAFDPSTGPPGESGALTKQIWLYWSSTLGGNSITDRLTDGLKDRWFKAITISPMLSKMSGDKYGLVY